jgi:chromosomal replication initiator protein
MDSKGLWQAVLGELEVTVSRANFATWFRHTSIMSQEDGRVTIAVPNIMTKNWLQSKFHTDIMTTLSKMNSSITAVDYKVGSGPSMALPLAKPSTGKRADSNNVAKSSQASLPITAASPANSNLNPRYTFANFVVASSNELAYAASMAVAKNPGTKYNPLYLYGGVGLGKTHLMQAVGNEILKDDPTKRIEYITIESFTNEFIGAIQKKQNSAFTDKFRNVDMLIIDDMQFLAGKEKTQDEFFHTFNALHQTNKQIIIASDKPPQLLVQLEERLRSRFAMGMVADIQSPDLETRSAILQAKAAIQGIILPLEVIDYLARHAQQNIRELEGALTQLLAFCEVRGLEPSVSAATQLLSGQAAARPKLRPLSPKAVIERVANYFDLQTADIIGAKRDKEIVVPRQITMYLMRHEMNLSFPKIAAAVGGRDHTTAMHSVSKIEKLLENDENLRSDVQALQERLATAVA